MTLGLLVRPDLTYDYIDFSYSELGPHLGGSFSTRISVAFWPGRANFSALYNAESKVRGMEPNPAASLAYKTMSTGDGSFLQAPTDAISGPVLFTGVEGGDIDAADAFQILDGIRAVVIYRQDNPEEFRLWRNAAINLGRLRFD